MISGLPASPSPQRRSRSRSADAGSSRLADKLDGDRKRQRRARRMQRCRAPSPAALGQIPGWHRSATLGRKPVREHQRLGAAVAVGRITLWSVRGPHADARLIHLVRGHVVTRLPCCPSSGIRGRNQKAWRDKPWGYDSQRERSLPPAHQCLVGKARTSALWDPRLR